MTRLRPTTEPSSPTRELATDVQRSDRHEWSDQRLRYFFALSWGVEGATAPTPAATEDFIFFSSANHCIEISANGGALACIGAGGSSVTVNGSGAGTNLSNGSRGRHGTNERFISDQQR